MFSYRYAQLRGWVLLCILLLILALLGGMIWRNLERFETVRAYVGYAHRIHELAADLQQAMTDYFVNKGGKLDEQRLIQLSNELVELARHDYHVAIDTPTKLYRVADLIGDASRYALTPDNRETLLLQALNITSTMLDEETLERERLMENIGRDIRTEVEWTFGTLAAFVLFGGIFFHRRILYPLNDLKELLLRLSGEDFRPIAIKNIDPLLLPVFNSYNVMIRQLAELEETKRHYAASLEAEVRSATQTLLEQQNTLGRAERLAAVGELAAGIAHELRNPLAGIQTTCVNLREELCDSEQVERVDLIIAELKRMGRMLNELLDQSRHTPAPISEFNLSEVLRELVSLVRYQIPPQVHLSFTAPEELRCRLPECRLRQSLLNLILNSAHALKGQAGQIRIETYREEACMVITITDDGPGFPPGLLDTGIRPFVTGRPGGTGLGLAMVQRFIREMGGQLTLSNIHPQGASVRLLIPCHRH